MPRNSRNAKSREKNLDADEAVGVSRYDATRIIREKFYRSRVVARSRVFLLYSAVLEYRSSDFRAIDVVVASAE